MYLGAVSTEFVTWLVGVDAWVRGRANFGCYRSKRKEVESIGEDDQVEVDRVGVWAVFRQTTG